MLRIESHSTSETGPGLRLEGQLIGPWVDELEAAIMRTRPGSGSMRLDLSGLRYADDRGLHLLRRLTDQGVAMENASLFIRELLHSPP